MTKNISSLQNPLIKQFLLFKEKSRARKSAGLFLIEGLREITLAIKGGYNVTMFLYHPELISVDHIKTLTNQDVDIIEVSKEVYERLAYRESTQGLIAIAIAKTFDLDSLAITNENPLILVAEAPEKPGNIGALLRTADAAKLDAVIIVNPKTDLYNPNVIRSSVGCVFTNQIAMGNTDEIISYLKEKKINIYCAALQASEPYTSQNYRSATALVVGTESKGLTDEWLNNSTQNIIIPMKGEIDSMNVSVAAGILIFEAKRQREFK